MMQQLFGYSATHAGYVSMPRGYGSLVAFLFAPILIGKIGARTTMLIGICISTVSLWQMGHYSLVMDESSLQISGFLQGAGSGMAFNPMSVLSFATLQGARRTEASVVGNMMRSISGSMGIAFYATLQLRQTETLRGHMVSHVVPGDVLTDMRLPDLGSDPGLAALSGEINRQAAMIGYNTAFGYMCLSSMLMLPIALMMRPARKAEKADPAAMAH
jgi:DHA2 family multidrug resistance protein